MRLTKRVVAELALPTGKAEALFADDRVPGLALRLREGGSRTWTFQFRVGRKQRRLTIGSASAISVADAQAAAAKLHARVKLGEDPAEAKQKAVAAQGETIAALLSVYLPRQRQRLRPRSMVEVERHLTVHARALHRLPADAVDRRAIAKVLARVGEENGPVAANLTRASLSAFFSWLCREGIRDDNPVIHTNVHAVAGSRERVLSDAEIKTVWAATSDGTEYGAIVKLLMLTGCRRNEIGGLKWTEVDLAKALIALPGARTKNNRPLDIPLTPGALALLETQPRKPDRDFIFGRGKDGFMGWARGKIALDAGTHIEPWTLHDLRRSMSTVMHDRLGVQPHVVEACLGHVSGHKAGVAGVYNRASYANEKRRALDLWAEHIASLIEGRDPKVVALRA
jgi:integrase